MSKLLRSTWLPVVVSLGLFVSLYAATPSYTSFDQLNFTTNNLRISLRSNALPIVVASNIYTTNLYVTNIEVFNRILIKTNVIINTNITINGTNVTTYADLIWTNDTQSSAGLIKVRPEITYEMTILSNSYTHGWVAASPVLIGISAGTNYLETDKYSSYVLFPLSTNAAANILTLKPGYVFGQQLSLMMYTNDNGGQCTLHANSDVFGGTGIVKLNNNQDWVASQGCVLNLFWAEPDWFETGRWYAGTNNQPTAITINPTDGRVPYRVDADEFGDSPWHVLTDTNSLGFNNTNPFLTRRSGNIGIGTDALTNTAGTGNNNIAIGTSAMRYWTNTAGANVAIGANALKYFASGLSSAANVAIGNNAFSSLTNGYQNVAISDAGLYATNLTNSILIGSGAGVTAQGLYNIAIGISALNQITNSEYNIALGYIASPLPGATNTIVVGNSVNATNSNEIVIGNSANTSTYIPSLLGLGLGSSGTSQITFGPGVTNVIYRSGSNFVITNSASNWQMLYYAGDGTGIRTKLNDGALRTLISGVGGMQSVGFSIDGTTNGLVYQGGHWLPLNDNVADLGSSSVNGAWNDTYIKGFHYIQAYNDGSGNATYMRLFNDGTNTVYDSTKSGSGTNLPHLFQIGGTNLMKIDSTSAAGETRFWIYDQDNGTMERVTVGIPDSGGAGYKLLRIPN